MVEPAVLTALVQFGSAGLMGVLWISERRGAAVREQQLTQAHERVLEHRAHADSLLRVVEANTRAITTLEASSRELAHAIARLQRARGRAEGRSSGQAGGQAAGAITDRRDRRA
jgi:hypothetical protein